jgi:hypothetical protein
MNELLRQLSSRAHIKIRNQFTGFFNTPEATKWLLKVEHCTHRGHFFEGENNDLDCLIQEALLEMGRIEQRYEDIKNSLSTLYPDENEYDIADKARDDL